MTKNNKIYLLLLYCISMIILSSCMAGGGSSSIGNPAGFFKGIWHGWIAPLSLILSFFNHNLSIYEINNVGWWYDFGFYIAVISPIGSLSLSRSKKS